MLLRIPLLIVLTLVLAAQTSIGPTSGLRIPVWDWSQRAYVYMTFDEFDARLPRPTNVRLSDSGLETAAGVGIVAGNAAVVLKLVQPATPANDCHREGDGALWISPTGRWICRSDVWTPFSIVTP